MGILLQLKGGFGGNFHFRAQFHCSADLPGAMIESVIQKRLLYSGGNRRRAGRQAKAVEDFSYRIRWFNCAEDAHAASTFAS